MRARERDWLYALLTVWQCERVLALPHAQHLTAEQVEYAADQVNRFYGG